MKKRVTYLFGAGASFGTIPIVREIPEELKKFAKTLNYGKVPREHNEHLQNFANKCLRLSELASASNAIDTYALNLHKQGEDEYFSLEQLKQHISLFFAAKQSINRPHHRTVQLLTKLIDYIKPNGNTDIEFNFVTWNYDFQLELSMNQVFRLKEKGPSGLISTLNVKANALPTFQRLLFKAPIIHLNGIAGIALHGQEQFKTVDLIRMNSGEDDVPVNCAYFCQEFARYNISTSNIFKFNFENKDHTDSLFTEAVNLLTNTDELVIIGYSFPRDNERFDKLWAKNLNKISKITVQDVNPNQERIKELFSSGRVVYYKQDVQDFYIPDFVEYA